MSPIGVIKINTITDNENVMEIVRFTINHDKFEIARDWRSKGVWNSFRKVNEIAVQLNDDQKKVAKEDSFWKKFKTFFMG